MVKSLALTAAIETAIQGERLAITDGLFSQTVLQLCLGIALSHGITADATDRALTIPGPCIKTVSPAPTQIFMQSSQVVT